MSRMVICMNGIQINGDEYIYKPVGSLLFLIFKDDQRIYSVFFILSYNSGSAKYEGYNVLHYVQCPWFTPEFSYYHSIELHNYRTCNSHDVIMFT